VELSGRCHTPLCPVCRRRHSGLSESQMCCRKSIRHAPACTTAAYRVAKLFTRWRYQQSNSA